MSTREQMNPEGRGLAQPYGELPSQSGHSERLLSRKEKIGLAILIIGVIAGWKSVEGAEVQWWLFALSMIVISIGWWMAFRNPRIPLGG